VSERERERKSSDENNVLKQQSTVNDLLSIPRERDFSKSSSSSPSSHTHGDVRWAVLHLPLLASVKSLRKWIAMPNRNIHRRKWIRKRRKTTTYSVNLARKHSWHELIREQATPIDRRTPAERVPAHILLLIFEKEEVTSYTHMIMSSSSSFFFNKTHLPSCAF
jgi:hypothetical protein